MLGGIILPTPPSKFVYACCLLRGRRTSCFIDEGVIIIIIISTIFIQDSLFSKDITAITKGNATDR